MNFAFAREYSITLEWSWFAINHTSKSFLIKHKQIGWIQRYKAGGEPYSDTTPFIVSEYSLLLPSMISYLTVYLREAAAGTHLGQERTDSRITSNCRSTIQENIFRKTSLRNREIAAASQDVEILSLERWKDEQLLISANAQTFLLSVFFNPFIPLFILRRLLWPRSSFEPSSI